MSESGLILVIGATGNVGGGLVPALLEKGASVRALVRDESKARGLWDGSVEIAVGDLARPESLNAAFEGVSRVFLLTAGTEDQVEMARNAIDAARRSGSPHIVRMSAFVPEPALDTILGRQHAEIEQELKSSGLTYTILRPTFFFQNTMMAAQTVASDGVVYIPFGDGSAGMIDVRDIVDVAVTVLTTRGHEGRTYTLTGPASISFHDVASGLSKALGREVSYVPVPVEAGVQAMVGMGISEYVANTFGEIFPNFAANGADRATGDVKKVTGHEARSYETFARDFAGVFGGQGQPASVSV